MARKQIVKSGQGLLKPGWKAWMMHTSRFVLSITLLAGPFRAAVALWHRQRAPADIAASPLQTIVFRPGDDGSERAGTVLAPTGARVDF